MRREVSKESQYNDIISISKKAEETSLIFIRDFSKDGR
jgi:hypothetical protein